MLGFAVAALIAMFFVWRRTLAARPWVRALGRLDGRWLVAVAALMALGYALYNDLTPADRQKFADEVDALDEPLSTVAAKVSGA